jgi:leader peptidase (prepilin peptidase)/N-methyltransferase
VPYVLLAVFYGSSIGSFLNLVADRLPQGQSVLRPSSHCPGCGRRLTPLELVPILSYLALRGRCYRCRTPIPLRVLGVEVVLGLLAGYLWWTMGISPASLLLFGYSSLFLLMAVIDLEHGIIPDVLVFPGLAAGLLVAPWWQHLGLGLEFLGRSTPGYLLLGSLAGGVAAGGAFALIVLLYPQGMGWGDVKMAGLIGVVGGIPGGLVALLVAVLSGGVVATLLLALRMRGRKQSIPFGPFLALGAIGALLWGKELWCWYLTLYQGPC